ncbi:MAG: nucleoside deaminase [Clostridia bacterium]|nr:nucleoside deaminase [Clostridia bacterium]
MDIRFMELAIEKAKEGAIRDEVPVGAVIVKGNTVLSACYNRKEDKNCAVFHAEIEAIAEASKKLNNWYLEDCEMYVTLEPCAMCAGALVNSRIKSLFFGASDPKAGCCGTLYNIPEDKRLNHTVNVVGGIMAEECAQLLSSFFKTKRKREG